MLTFQEKIDIISKIIDDDDLQGISDRYKDKSINRLKDVLSRVKLNGIPSQNSKNKQEKSDATFVVSLRQAKNGKGTCVWYSEYDDIIKEHKCEYVFYTRKEKEIENGISRLKEILSKIKINGIPSQRSTDKQEKSDAGVVTSLRRAKQGKKGRIWYPEYDNVIKEYKGEYIFDTQKEQSISRLKDVLSRVKLNGIPSHKSKNKQEKSDVAFVGILRMAKRGKGKSAWRPEYNLLIKEYKCEHLFHTRKEKEIENGISRLKEILSKIKINGIPSQRSTDKQEKSDANFVCRLRQRQRKNFCCPEYDNIIKEYKCEYVFN